MASNSNSNLTSGVQSNSISKYFTPVPDDKKGDLKRDRPTPSSAESLSATPACKKTLVLNSSFDSPDNNKSVEFSKSPPTHTVNEMSQSSTTLESLKEMIVSMQATLANVATKDDINRVSGECSKVYERLDALTKKVDDSLEKFEGRLYEVEKKMDAVIEENKTLRAANTELYDKLDKQFKDLNDLQQYSRRRNLRVFNLEESVNETANDTEKKVCEKFTNILKVKTTPDIIDACHRVPWSGAPPTFKNGKPRPRDIIIQFKSRKDRDFLFSVKSRCKDQGFSLGEDLTGVNAKLCMAVHKHQGFSSSWSSSGKVKGKLKNGKVINIPVGSDLNDLVKKNT